MRSDDPLGRDWVHYLYPDGARSDPGKDNVTSWGTP